MKIGLFVACYNRPELLKKLLISIDSAKLPDDTFIFLYDDNSTDQSTKEILLSYAAGNLSKYSVYLSNKNQGIKKVVKACSDHLFSLGFDIVINLDSDSVIHPNFIEKMIEVYEITPNTIVTGFNCRTKNKDGSERHVIVKEHEKYNEKNSVGGINMMYNRVVYQKYILPALEKAIEVGGNWDHMACLNLQKDNKTVSCVVPSVVQHTGITISTMGHNAGGEPPDIADDFYDFEFMKTEDSSYIGKKEEEGKIRLSDVTLVGVDCVNIERLIRAANISSANIEFGHTVLLSSLPSSDKRVTRISAIRSRTEYSRFLMKQLADYIPTKYLLIIQHDGFVLNPHAWDDDWRQYDYIGAPWEWYTDGKNVGNGGFSFRSKKIMQITANDKGIIPMNELGVTFHEEEDHCICRIYRDYLENEYKMKFAPIEVARKFAIEGWKVGNPVWNNEFGFHGPHLKNIKL